LNGGAGLCEEEHRRYDVEFPAMISLIVCMLTQWDNWGEHEVEQNWTRHTMATVATVWLWLFFEIGTVHLFLLGSRHCENY
jgi:hypothetical protein